jgi:hypothetical protein
VSSGLSGAVESTTVSNNAVAKENNKILYRSKTHSNHAPRNRKLGKITEAEQNDTFIDVSINPLK